MSLFSFRDDKIPAVSAESSAPVSPSEGNIAAADAKAAALTAAPISRKARKRQGETGTDSSGIATPSAELRAEISKQLEASFDPKAWGALLALPANAALALTGHAHWETSKEERDTMGTCGAIAARYLMVENPKTLALLMLSSAMFTVYVPRLQQEFKVRQAKKTATQPEPKPNV